jgi:SpoVK/Ycf46/Vps4 family AAA+-type ATPase
LKFLQDNDHGVYVIMTSNDVSQLPPEFTRTGRLDAQWFFDLPDDEAREEIFKIHFATFKRELPNNLMRVAVENSRNYTGAEIKEVVKNVMRKAFIRFRREKLKKQDISKEDILTSLSEVTPVFDSNREKIQALRNWVKGRARFTDGSDEDNDNGGGFDPLSSDLSL